MSRKLNNLIKQKRNLGQKLLSVFITAGFPNKSDTVKIILSLEKAGVDFIELGIPFSDPIADGTVIQAASEQSLSNGVTLSNVFEYVKEVRKQCDIPILLMGYLNPFFRFGIEEAIKISGRVGVDGWIIPDWPLEESESYLPALISHDIDIIHLIAPNTSLDRIRKIDSISNSFIYCVSYTGVTGKNNRPVSKALSFFNEIRKIFQRPLIIGFGIKNHEDYLTYSSLADGVIIGSAFIKMIQNTPGTKLHSSILEFVKNIRYGSSGNDKAQS